jgi:hypothetical protein
MCIYLRALTYYNSVNSLLLHATELSLVTYYLLKLLAAVYLP